MAMFPPSLPHALIRWLSKAGDTVYDPFSGRGTTLLEARLLGRLSVGSDASPLAWLLSSAKVDAVSAKAVLARLTELDQVQVAKSTSDVPSDIKRLFAKSVLRQLITLRKQLSRDDPVDRFVLATLCGILHANAATDGRPRGLTVAMPNTFAMAPRYVARYIKEHSLKAPVVNVVEMTRRRVDALDIQSIRSSSGKAWMADARRPDVWPDQVSRPALIVTSPPYLHVMRYGKLNWIRAWLIGETPREIDDRLFATASLPRYLAFMTEVLTSLRRRLRADGFICLVIGDVRYGDKTLNLANAVVEECVAAAGLDHRLTIADELPIQHKVSRIWGDSRGQATKTDRIIVLGGSKAPDLPAIPMIDWGSLEEDRGYERHH